MNKLARVLEWLWLLTAIVSFIAGIMAVLQHTISKNYLFFVFSVISFLMFFYRRNQRIQKAS